MNTVKLKRNFAGIGIVAVIALLSCSRPRDPEAQMAGSSDTSYLADSPSLCVDSAVALVRGDTGIRAQLERSNEFAVRLFERINAERITNVFFSPYSITIALAQLYAGAQGHTRLEMAEVLGLPLRELYADSIFSAVMMLHNVIDGNGAVSLKSANSIWIQKGFRLLDGYRRVVSGYYAAAIELIDLIRNYEAALRRINDWISEKTMGKINNAIAGPLRGPMLIVNTVYFQGNWLNEFSDAYTAQAPFYVSKDVTVTVDMMLNSSMYAYAEDENVQILELPYVDRHVSMLVVLPKKDGKIDNIGTLLRPSLLLADKLASTIVRVWLPRCTVFSEYESMRAILIDSGLREIFSLGADFSGITARGGLFVSDVIHKAYINWDEKGTEAAAVTIIKMVDISFSNCEPMEVDFVVDRPFLFVIRENHTGAILFIGRVTDPTRAAK